jgi:hypothetical protein
LVLGRDGYLAKYEKFIPLVSQWNDISKRFLLPQSRIDFGIATDGISYLTGILCMAHWDG